MQGVNGSLEAMQVQVFTTNGQGHSVEFWADRVLTKLINVADSAPNPIREQANIFRADVRRLLVYYMREAIKSDRTTLYNALKAAGHNDVAELIIKI
jgi:hypothetical protein